MRNTCSMHGCIDVVEGHGLCNKHYLRWRRHGDPTVMKRAPNGTGSINGHGYRQINRTDGGEIEHIAIVERVLGRKLGQGVEIHHFNEIRSDNRNCNLVVCPNRAYHQLLHVRQRALAACGDANWRLCAHCGRYDDPKNLKTYKSQQSVHFHAECRVRYSHDRYEQRKNRAVC